MRFARTSILFLVLLLAALSAPAAHAQEEPLTTHELELSADDSTSTGQMTLPHARPNISLSDDYKVTSFGFGGHGALFDPVISAHDPNTIIASCDMGGVYVSHDRGGNWDIKSCGGRIWDIQGDPSSPGVFYATGSGLWRTSDYGDNWQLLWPDPSTVEYTPTKLNHTRTYYFSTDSYPNASVVDTMCVDKSDPSHIVALTSAAANYADTDSTWRQLFESFDGGRSFACIARFKQQKTFKEGNFVNTRLFIEGNANPHNSRVVVVIADGIYGVDRNAALDGALSPLYVPSETIGDVQQVTDADGTHYIVLENVDDATAAAQKSRISLWHTTDFLDPGARVDLTSELVASLPRHANSKSDLTGEKYEIAMHNVMAVKATNMNRMYLAYKTTDYNGPSTWQGVCGLVKFDASAQAGKRFSWVFGLRLWWDDEDADTPITPDQNRIMARGHCDAAYAFLGIAVDPSNDKRIALTDHDNLMYSPDIDADVGRSGRLANVNIYPRYATSVAPNPDYPNNVNYSFMQSHGLEVTVVQHVATDPFDPQHIVNTMDDAGIAHTYDGGATWTTVGSGMPSTAHDTCFDAVFDKGRRNTVYGVWHTNGGSPSTPAKDRFSQKGVFARSFDGGITWEEVPSSGLPENMAGVKIAVSYPKDANGAITDGARTIYIATFNYGFFVSHDSGQTFEPMNEGIPTSTVSLSGGQNVEAIWARDILVTDDGRLFGITQYSSLGPSVGGASATYHSVQDERTFGNVWEWDANDTGGRGAWKKLPFNSAGAVFDSNRVRTQDVQVRQPRAMCYDSATRTLYVAAVCCMGPYATSDRWTNFGGGLYTYTDSAGAATQSSGQGAALTTEANGQGAALTTEANVPVGSGQVKALDPNSAIVGEQRNLTGVFVDSARRLWVATEDGSAYVGDGKGAWQAVCSGIPILNQGFDASTDDTLFMTTRGAGAFRIDMLNRDEPSTPETPSVPETPETPGGTSGGNDAGKSGEAGQNRNASIPSGADDAIQTRAPDAFEPTSTGDNASSTAGRVASPASGHARTSVRSQTPATGDGASALIITCITAATAASSIMMLSMRRRRPVSPRATDSEGIPRDRA